MTNINDFYVLCENLKNKSKNCYNEISEIYKKDKHVLHPYEDFNSRGTYDRKLITKSDNIYLYDENGNKFIDGPGGMWCNNIGHGNKEIAEAAIKVACFLVNFISLYNFISGFYLVEGICTSRSKLSLFPLYVLEMRFSPLFNPLKFPFSTKSHKAYFAFPSMVNRPK